MKKFLIWLTAYLPCRIIKDGDQPYLERYYVATIFGMHIYLHRFVASDPDRGLHDHPWRWAFSVILVGWYLEQTRYGTTPVRWFNKLTGDSFHRVILPHATWFPNGPQYARPEPVWTLFMHRAKREKAWGFLRDVADIGTIFKKHEYRIDELGRDEQWWTTAPIGRNSGRML